MASYFYSKIAPDYTDGPNETGKRPGILVEVVEQDGGVGVSMSLEDGDDRHKLAKGDESRGVFLHVDDAQELVEAVQEAIDRARPKNADHGWRTREK